MSTKVNDINEDITEYLTRATRTSSQLVHSKAIPIPYLIEPFLIRSQFHIITGKIGSMKSFFSLYLAGQLAEKGENVIYIDKENGIMQIEARARLLDLPDVDNLQYWSERPNMDKSLIPPDFRKIALYEQIIKTIKQPILIFDTLNRFGGGSLDENSVKDVTRLTEPLISLARKGATLLVIHQAGKESPSFNGQAPYLRRYRGSSEIGGACDQAYQIINHKQLSPSSASFTIQCFKTRWLPFEDQHIVFDAGSFYTLPKHIPDAETFLEIRSKITKYLKQCPEVRKQEITEALGSKKWGNYRTESVGWLLDNCRKNYWMKLQGTLPNSIVYKNIPEMK